MNNVFIIAALSLLTAILCSCGGGDGSTDCSSTLTLVQTSTGKVVASATVAVAPTDGLLYSIVGTNLDNVAGIQLDITYDAASLSSPTVTQGSLVSGAIFVANTTRPGAIRIAIISEHPFSGNGEIATVSFASKTGNGGISSITTNMINSQGSAVAASPDTTTNNNTSTPSSPSPPASQSQQQNSTTTATSSAACR